MFQTGTSSLLQIEVLAKLAGTAVWAEAKMVLGW